MKARPYVHCRYGCDHRLRGVGGFSLLEMSIVLGIIGILVAMGMTAGLQMVDSARLVATANKLDAIEEALAAFRANNNRLPCPGDATLLTTDSHYGAESVDAGSCRGGAVYNASGIRTATGAPLPNANLYDAGNNVVEGSVPFRVLNLPESFMYDGWGRRFAYAVSASVTAIEAMRAQTLSDLCGITVSDASNLVGAGRSSGAVYALVSFGPDGHGGYLKTGTRMSAGSNDAGELANCHCTTSAGAGVYDLTATPYVQADPTATFGSLVRFKERWQLQTYDDQHNPNLGPVCTTGASGTGLNGGDYFGSSVATGDVNGDGIPDLIIGAPGANGTNGAVYVVFGTKNGFPNPLPTSSLNGTNGFRLDGVLMNGTGERAGWQVAAGDFNGDGIADIGISAMYGIQPGYPEYYVVFGHSGAWPASQTLDVGSGHLIDGVHGVRFDGGGSNGALSANFAFGDVNGNGIADLIAYNYTAATKDADWVVFGKRTPWPSAGNVALTSLADGVQGFSITNNSGGTFGFPIAAGDINGDGIADLLIGSAKATSQAGLTQAGRVYVIFGKKTAWAASATATSLADGTAGFWLDGETMNAAAGTSLAAADLNGDGISDILIGAPGVKSSSGSNWSGAVYVVFGHSGPWTNTVLTTSPTGLINGTTGIRFDGAAVSESVGQNVGSAAINGNGVADLVVSSSGKSGYYVVYGKKASWASDAPNGYVLLDSLTNGVQGTFFSGVSIPAASLGTPPEGCLASGDLTGDGIPDLVMGAPWNPNSTGSVYVAYGRPASSNWPASMPVSGLH